MILPRTILGLRAGQALWSTYLRGLRLPDEDRLPPEKTDALKKTYDKSEFTGK